MTTRRWILNKDMRRCSLSYKCVGYDKANARPVVVDAARGIVEVTCRECGTKDTRQADKFKEIRPCKRCKDPCDFTVSLWQSAGSKKVTEHWRQYCGICELEMSAASHARTAKAFAARALRLRTERAKKRLAAKRSSKVSLLVAEEIKRGAAPALATNQTIRELVAAEEEVE